MKPTRFSNPVSANPTPGSPMPVSSSGESVKGGVRAGTTAPLDYNSVKDHSLYRNREPKRGEFGVDAAREQRATRKRRKVA